MIYQLRRYALTLVVVAIALIWRTPLPIALAGVAAALLLDLFVSSRSKDLPLYREGLDFAAPAPATSLRQAVRLHLIAVIAGPGVAFAARLFDAPPHLQQVANVAALLICGSVSCYTGALQFGKATEPRHIFYRIRQHGNEIGYGNDFLPSRPRALAMIAFRLGGTVFMMFFFAFILAALRTMQADLQLALLLVGAAFLFQFAFQLLFQALFLLRWWRRPHDLVAPWHPLARKD